jgi:5-methylcytosine-specific restriction protein B
MADEYMQYPEFLLRLPNGGPQARGRVLPERGMNGSLKFLVLAGSPVRAETLPGIGPHAAAQRAALLANGAIREESDRWPGCWETTRDIECNSPSAAASVVAGRSSDGLSEWRTEDGFPLVDYLGHSWRAPHKAWLVRGSNVSGRDLVKRLWVSEGWVSLAASHLPQGIEEGPTKSALRRYVQEGYDATASYSQKQAMADELHYFLSQMRCGDTLCTISNGQLYVGTVSGDAEQVESEGGLSNLRRKADWRPVGIPYDGLPEELQQKLSVQHDVVDLTSVLALIEGLGLSDEELAEEAEAVERDPSVEIPAIIARREPELPEPTDELAAELLVHDTEWLREVRDLLADERQLVLYGPPGTGKTYLALKLAEFLGGGPEQVQLVQFHPAYAYEDFIEGFRPKEDPDTKEVAFRLTAGPLRDLRDLATREGNRHIPHFLVIDEINRANVAKVFGELYFLLEYRNKSVRLPYSGDDFALPPNLFVIGTMNTADRSIALVDAAMRRRFAFVELSPRAEPTSGLLRRWLAREGKDAEPADLLDALNSRIDDKDFRIGPSYLMKKGVYRDGGLERTWRTKILPLLEEHHYGEGVDIEKRYGLAALRESLAKPLPESPA